MANLTRTCPRLPWMVDFHSDASGTIPNAQLKAAFCSRTIDHACELHVASKQPPYRLVQVMAAIGESSNTEEILKQMMAAGMTLARIKMADYNQENALDMIRNIRRASDAYSKTIGRVYQLPIALDLKGPDIRTGSFKDPETRFLEFIKGQQTCLTTDNAFEEYVTEDMIYVDYQKIDEVIHPGDSIALDDGSVTLTAVEIAASIVRCIVERAGRIASRAKVNLTEVPVDLPALSFRDREDLIFGVKEKVDIVIVSNTKQAETLKLAREILTDNGGEDIKVIAKIETIHGVYNIEEIMEAADAIMLARSALSLSLPMEKVFLAQKSIIAKCNKAGIPVLVSQLLYSITEHLLPNKAELASVTSAVLDGADCLVFTQETSVGKYPVHAVKTLTKICVEAEAAFHYKRLFYELTEVSFPIEATEAICMSAVDLSLKVNAAVIIICTTSGRTARLLAKYRPRCPIIAITRYAQLARSLPLHRGIYPLVYLKPSINPWQKDVDNRIQFGITFSKYSGYIRAGDVITILSGSRPGAGFINTIKVAYASEFDTVFKKN